MTARSKNIRNIILLGFILLKFLLQYYLINPRYDLQRDEYLHLDQANHLALGYLSVPPATSWIACIIQLAGGSVYWVRFFPALFGALTIIIVWKTIETLKGNLYALILGATCVLLSALIRINFLFQPNSLDVLCWTACYFAIIQYFRTAQPKWIYITACVFAIGFLNKYNIVFLLIGLLPAILMTEQRNIFAKKEFYIALLLALLLISPNLYWQYTNDFPVFRHFKVLNDTQLIHVNRWLFLREQLSYFLGALPVLIASLYALLFYRPFRKYKFLFWSFLFSLITFVYLRAKGYYAIGIYPIYIALGSVYLADILKQGKRFQALIYLALPVIIYALLFNIVFRIESPTEIIKRNNVYKKIGLLRWEDGKDHSLPQDFADMLGWKELAAKVELAYNGMPKDTRTVILCDNYGQAGAINYYAGNKAIRAVSFNADYINWFEFEKPADNVIRVKVFADSKDEFAKTSPYFQKSVVADSVNNPMAREYKTTIFVFTGSKTDVNKRLKAEIEEEK